MAVRTDISRYEVLFRWRDGELAGIHAQDLIRIYDGDKLISEQVSNARPVSVGELEGIYPAATVAADLSALQGEFDAAKAAWAAEREAYVAQIKSLTANAKEPQ
jgi:hypothetical protein